MNPLILIEDRLEAVVKAFVCEEVQPIIDDRKDALEGVCVHDEGCCFAALNISK